MLDDIIRFGLPDIFAVFEFDQISAYTIKLTRDAELDIEDDITHSLLEKISQSVRKRVKGNPVRFVFMIERFPGGPIELHSQTWQDQYIRQVNSWWSIP